MAEPGGSRPLPGLLSPGIVAAGILAGAWVVTAGSASGAWWTLHAGAVVLGASLLVGAALEMNRSTYPPGAVLLSAFVLALALLISASIMGDPAAGPLLLPVWGAGGGFLVVLLPRPDAPRSASGWALLGGAAMLAAGVVLGTLILAS